MGSDQHDAQQQEIREFLRRWRHNSTVTMTIPSLPTLPHPYLQINHPTIFFRNCGTEIIFFVFSFFSPMSQHHQSQTLMRKNATGEIRCRTNITRTTGHPLEERIMACVAFPGRGKCEQKFWFRPSFTKLQRGCHLTIGDAPGGRADSRSITRASHPCVTTAQSP